MTNGSSIHHYKPVRKKQPAFIVGLVIFECIEFDPFDIANRTLLLQLVNKNMEIFFLRHIQLSRRNTRSNTNRCSSITLLKVTFHVLSAC